MSRSRDRLDPEVVRMYGIALGDIDYATTINDGPKVRQSETAPRPLGDGLTSPQNLMISVVEPSLELHPDGFTLRWHEELGGMLAKRLSDEELLEACQSLSARLCLDLHRIVHKVGSVEHDYALARQQAIRAR